MLKFARNSQLPRWRLLEEIRRRRQVAMASRQQQQKITKEQEDFYVDELLGPSVQSTQTFTPTNTTAPAQQVLSLLQQSPNQHVGSILYEASFSPITEHLVSLLDNLQHLPRLQLQTLMWSFRHPDFQVSPSLASRIAPILPLPRPPSVDRFLADAHTFWMYPDAPVPVAIVDPLLSLYCHASYTLDDILEVFSLMRKKGVTLGVNQINQVMQAAVSKQYNVQVDKADLLFKHLLRNGPPPNEVSYNIMIYGLSEAGNSEEALRLFEEMMARSLSVSEATCSSLIHGIVKTGDYDKALWLMQQMKYNGVRPSLSTYAFVLQGLCGNGKYQNAASLLNDMKVEGLTVDHHTHQLLVSSLSQALGVQEAEAFQMLYGQNLPTEAIY